MKFDKNKFTYFGNDMTKKYLVINYDYVDEVLYFRVFTRR